MDKFTDGLKHDGGKPRLSLVPPEMIEAVGAVMTHGADKYGVDSYKQVAPVRYRDALMRHLCKWLKTHTGLTTTAVCHICGILLATWLFCVSSTHRHNQPLSGAERKKTNKGI